MGNTQMIMAAVVGIFVAGFIMVGSSKEKSTAQLESESMVRSVVAMQEMAGKKCPAAIKEHTGDQVFFPSETDTDKETYVTMKWLGDNTDHFKTASCTLHIALGGISNLVIDDKVLIDKKM